MCESKKLQWMKNPFYVSSKMLYLKGNNITSHFFPPRYKWFFQKKKVIDDVQAISIGTTFEQSASERKNNSDLLEEDEEQ